MSLYILLLTIFCTYTYLHCSHFDPNGSGSVNYGEFVWAFYNKRHLLHKWKKVTDQMSPVQLVNKFHQADTNGDGTLSLKEFIRFIKYMLKMDIPDGDIVLLFEKFDSDKDGTLDLEEFTEFMEKEMHVSESKQLALKSYENHDICESEEDQNMHGDVKRSKSRNKLVYKPPTKRGSPRRTHSATAGSSNRSNPNPPPYSESKEHSNNSSRSTNKLNHTTPGKLQGNNTISYDRPKSAASRNNPPRNKTNSTDSHAKNEAGAGPESESEEVSVPPTNSLLWINHILQKQADLESKLGHVYY